MAFTTKKIAKFIAGVAALLAITTSPAWAVCDVCVTGAIATSTVAITTAITSAAGSITGGISTAAGALEQTINLAQGRVSSSIAASANVIASTTADSASKGSTLISKTMTTAMLAKEQSDTAQMYQVTDPCTVIAPAQGMSSMAATETGRSGVYSAAAGDGGPTAGPSGTSKAVIAANNIANGSMPAPSPEATAAAVAAGGCSEFAQGARAAQCTSAGLAPQNLSPYPNADIRAETLVDGPQKSLLPSQFLRVRTISPNADSAGQLAVRSYIRNLSSPITLSTLSGAQLKTVAGKNYMALKDVYKARMALAEKAFADQAGYITATQQTVPILQQLLAGQDAPFVTAYLNRNYPNWRQDGISESDMINLEVERRYANAGWYVKLTAMSPTEIARDQAEQMAFQSFMLQKILGQLMRLRLENGESLASRIRQEMTPQLIQAHASASQ